MKVILVIEDNLELRENTAELLGLYGYKVMTAPDGKSGFEKSIREKPDVIICDMMMPGTDGPGFLALAKSTEITAHIPLIFFSAGPVPADAKENIKDGEGMYIQKPFSNYDLLNAVEKSLRR
ncbi:MAG: response regulator [Flavobacterium sp.]